MPNRKGLDDVVDFLLFPLQLPFQLLDEKAPGSLRNSELRNLIPPRPPLPHEILDQAIKPGSKEIGRRISNPGEVKRRPPLSRWMEAKIAVAKEKGYSMACRLDIWLDVKDPFTDKDMIVRGKDGEVVCVNPTMKELKELMRQHMTPGTKRDIEMLKMFEFR